MKKALSIILALTLAFSLLPTFAFAAETTETGVYKFEFGTDVMSEAVKAELVEYGSTGARFYIRRGNAVSGPGWNVITTTNLSDILHKNNDNKLVKIFQSWIVMGFTKSSLDTSFDTLYIEVTIPENGTYDVAVVCRNSSTGANIDVNLDDTWTGEGELYATGTNGDNAGAEITIPVATRVYLEKGIHTLCFKNRLEEGNYNSGETTFENSVYRAEFTLTEPGDVQLITEAFTTETSDTTAYNPSVSGVGYNASEGNVTVEGITATLQEIGEYKGYYKMSAPEKNGDAPFLYWAKGLSNYKKIVSYENEFYYAPAGGDNNVLIAVYDKSDSTSNKAEFYNANGQLIKIITDTSKDKTVPELPSMAGYKTASLWKQYNGDAEAVVGSELTPEGTMLFVAQYENEKPIDVTVTVVNGNGTDTVSYGELVTCTPDSEKGVFKWWKREVNGVSEIISIDETYKFLAWENCTVTAEYAEEKPQYNGEKKKIIIDRFNAGNEIGIMAEFIGFGSNVVEKGIMWNNNKIAMTKPGTQFSVVADKNGEYKGYAIVGNEQDGYTLITDGSVTISDAE